MDGILIIDKPAGITSHDVVARVRRILRTKRVGHTGTLDPFATGVLVLLIGKATRLAPFVDKDEKEYEALIQFGFETDSGDVTGRRKAEGGAQKAEGGFRNAEFEPGDLENVFAMFRGEILQTPPMYSAKKVEGKKLYELARKGIEVERKPVKVTIHTLELLAFRSTPPVLGGVAAASADGVVSGWSTDGVVHSEPSESALRIRVVCSAGTYIRTLAEDIGRAVGVPAHLAELRRSRAGRFDIAEAVTLEQLEESDNASALLKPITEVVEHLPKLDLSAERAAKTRAGLATRIETAEFDNGAAVRMLDENSNLIAIGIYDDEQKIVKPKIVLV